MLSHERVKEVVNYDHLSGEFRWIKKLSFGTHIGSLCGTLDKKRGYIRICIDRHIVRAHRLAWFHFHGVWPSDEIDHIDGNKINNSIRNLRVTDRATNQQNMRSASRISQSNVLGVGLHKATEKWRARIWVDDRNKSLGLFQTKEEAHFAYVEAKRKFHKGNTL